MANDILEGKLMELVPLMRLLPCLQYAKVAASFSCPQPGLDCRGPLTAWLKAETGDRRTFYSLNFFCKTESPLFFFSPFSLGPMFRKWETWSSWQNCRRQYSLGKARGKGQGKWSFSLKDSIFRWEWRLTGGRFPCLRKWYILHVSFNHIYICKCVFWVCLFYFREHKA